MFIELLDYIELTKKLICTCSPTLVLTKGTKSHQRKVSSARLIVYTAHFIRAGLDFQDRVPVYIRARTTSRHGPNTGEILVRHRWGKVVYTTKTIRAEPIFVVRVLFSSEPCQKFSAV